jgi:hypothetical protein
MQAHRPPRACLRDTARSVSPCCTCGRRAGASCQLAAYSCTGRGRGGERQGSERDLVLAQVGGHRDALQLVSALHAGGVAAAEAPLLGAALVARAGRHHGDRRRGALERVGRAACRAGHGRRRALEERHVEAHAARRGRAVERHADDANDRDALEGAALEVDGAALADREGPCLGLDYRALAPHGDGPAHGQEDGDDVRGGRRKTLAIRAALGCGDEVRLPGLVLLSGDRRPLHGAAEGVAAAGVERQRRDGHVERKSWVFNGKNIGAGEKIAIDVHVEPVSCCGC